MRITVEDSILVNIDFQDKLIPHMFNADELKKKTIGLIKGIKALQVPMLTTQQYTRGLGFTDAEISAALGAENPEELSFIEKSTFSCLDCDEFRTALEKSGKRNVIIAGIEGHVCVLQTIVDLKSAGYNPIPVLDCISSRKETDYLNGIKRYTAENVTPTCFESILFELCRTSKNPVFKEISSIVK
ncbi:MAG: isochorismatase family protein [Spirochaetales bacterium]|nr:isochorismatase family protein [Spirochaetales bacterium]